MNAQDMIERYAHAVARRLPSARRRDIEAELTSLLKEEVAARTEAGEAELDAARAVIQGFGPPATAALDYHTAAPVIEPRHTPLFTKIIASILGALIVLSISVALSDPSAPNEPDFGQRLSDEAVAAGLQILGLVLLIFWVTGVWIRRRPAPRWSPDRLPPVKDPDAINRPQTVLFIAVWMAGFAVLALGPTTVFDAASGGAAPQALLDAFAYDTDFTGMRANLLWATLGVSLAIYAWPLIPGRRSQTWRRLSAGASVALALLIYTLVLAGDIFASEPANEYMKLAMAIFAGWGLIDGASGLIHGRHRPSGPPTLQQA